MIKKSEHDEALALVPKIAAEVRYSLPQLLAEIRAEGTNRAMGLEHLSQGALQSLFKTFKERNERARTQ